MNVLILSQYAGSPDLGMVTRNYNWAVELQKQGHKATIVAGSYSHYRNKHPEMQGETIKFENIDGVQYMWVKTPCYKGESAIGRILSMIVFQWRLRTLPKIFKDNKFDAVVASSPHPFVVFPARQLAKKHGAKFIYDIRDLWPLTLRKIAGMSKWHPFIMALQYAENFACRYADLVTCVPQNAKRYLMQHGMEGEKFLHIGNGYLPKQDGKEISLNPEYTQYIQSIKDKNGIIISYCGAFGQANALHSAIEAIAKTTNKNIHLLLVGKGHYKDNLISLVQDLGVKDRVHIMNPIPHAEISDLLSKVDIAYIGLLYSSLFKYGASPAKMNDYLAAAKPILYAIGDPKNPVEKCGCGISCRAEDSDQISQAMDDLANMSAHDRQSLGQKGYDWLMANQTIEKQVASIIKNLAD